MSRKWTLIALISTVLGAAEAVVYKKVLVGMPYHEVAFVDSFCLAVLFAALGGWKISDKSRKGLFYLLVGSLISALGVLFYFLSLQHLNSIDFSFLGRNHILFSVILAFFFLGERPTKTVWSAIVLAMVGAYFFTFSSLDSSTLTGILCAFMFCSAYAVRGLFLKLGPVIPTKSIMFWTSLFSMLLSGFTSFAVEQTVKTAVGARTMALDTKTHHAFTVSAEYGPPPPPDPANVTPSGRPRRGPMVPGSFTIIEVGK